MRSRGLGPLCSNGFIGAVNCSSGKVGISDIAYYRRIAKYQKTHLQHNSFSCRTQMITDSSEITVCCYSITSAVCFRLLTAGLLHINDSSIYCRVNHGLCCRNVWYKFSCIYTNNRTFEKTKTSTPIPRASAALFHCPLPKITSC